ncbi:hypothetical protein BFINE_09270 [Bacteroides finegoldii DSM 17565]|nr:hypothetical protein BFINE_09270 [Bacteroides finegoldii DSM 17565]
MLKLGDNSDLKASKLYEASPGRFVYKVDADRETERSYFPGSNVVNKDNTPNANVNQTGERKTLHFTTKSIVSAGDIVISSNEEKVVFYSKTFRVTNKSMAGTSTTKMNPAACNRSLPVRLSRSSVSATAAVSVPSP